eukprot:UN07870
MCLTLLSFLPAALDIQIFYFTILLYFEICFILYMFNILIYYYYTLLDFYVYKF